MNLPRPKRKRRRWVRALLWSATVVLGLPLAYGAAAFGLALIPVNGGFRDAPEADGIEVFLVSNGIHVDFLVPAATPEKDWTREVPRRDFRGVDESHSGLLLGWGNRKFYLETPTWADLKLSTVGGAVFWPSATVVHAQYVDWRPPRDDPSSRRVVLTEAAYRKLCGYLEASFRKDGSGAFVLIPGKGYGADDNFYEGVGSYHAFNTCNLWTNRGLKQAGVRTALWSPFAQGILWHLP